MTVAPDQASAVAAAIEEALTVLQSVEVEAEAGFEDYAVAVSDAIRILEEWQGRNVRSEVRLAAAPSLDEWVVLAFHGTAAPEVIAGPYETQEAAEAFIEGSDAWWPA